MSEPVNSFLLFCKDYRAIFAASNPGLSNCEVTTLLAKEWKYLDDETKQQYKAKSHFLKKQFKHCNPNYSRKCKNSEFQNLMFNFKVSVKRSSSPIRKPSSPVITRRNSNNVYPTTEVAISQPQIQLREKPSIQSRRRIASCPTNSYNQVAYNPVSYPTKEFSRNTSVYNTIQQPNSFNINQQQYDEDLSFLNDVVFNSTWSNSI